MTKPGILFVFSGQEPAVIREICKRGDMETAKCVPADLVKTVKESAEKGRGFNAVVVFVRERDLDDYWRGRILSELREFAGFASRGAGNGAKGFNGLLFLAESGAGEDISVFADMIKGNGYGRANYIAGEMFAHELAEYIKTYARGGSLRSMWPSINYGKNRFPAMDMK